MRLIDLRNVFCLAVAAANLRGVSAGRPIFPLAHSRTLSPHVLQQLRAGSTPGQSVNTPVPWKDVGGDPRSRFYVIGQKQNKMTYSLVGVTAAAFVAQIAVPKFTSFGIKISAKIKEGEELYRLFTPIFLHGNLQHIMTNMASLIRIGGNVEQLFGSGRYFATYLVAGIAGNVCSALASPTNSLGASGSVFGIIGAFAVFLTRNGNFLGAQGQRTKNSILQTMLVNLALGFFQTSIDQWAHLGGAIGGAVMAFFVGPRLYYTRTPKGKVAVVDKPFWRVPAAAETIPAKVSHKLKQLVSKVLGRPEPKPFLPSTLDAPQPVVSTPPPATSPKKTKPASKSSSFLRFWDRFF